MYGVGIVGHRSPPGGHEDGGDVDADADVAVTAMKEVSEDDKEKSKV
jgi:hypothetical protein